MEMMLLPLKVKQALHSYCELHRQGYLEGTACNLMELYNFMQGHAIAGKLMELHERLWNCIKDYLTTCKHTKLYACLYNCTHLSAQYFKAFKIKQLTLFLSEP